MADSQVIFKYNGHEGQQRIPDLGSCCVCMWAHTFLYVCMYTCMCEGQRTTLSVFSQMLSTSLNFFAFTFISLFCTEKLVLCFGVEVKVRGQLVGVRSLLPQGRF